MPLEKLTEHYCYFENEEAAGVADRIRQGLAPDQTVF